MGSKEGVRGVEGREGGESKGEGGRVGGRQRRGEVREWYDIGSQS